MRLRRTIPALLLLAGLLLLLPVPSGAEERILLYKSNATVLADSTLMVREDITVNVE